MLKTRVLTALVLLGILLAALFVLPTKGGLALFALLLLLGAWEWAPFQGWTSPLARLGYCVIAAAVCYGCWHYPDAVPRRAVFTLAFAWWCFATLWILFFPRHVARPATEVAGLIVLVPTWLALAYLLTGAGPSYVMYLLLLVWAADIGAYFAGRSFGRHALAPLVSPKKTWEGAAGGVALSLVIAAGGVVWFGWPALPFMALSLVTVVLSIVGDLTESMFKRNAGLKDSGSILPGHGGILDRIDSVTAAAPVFALGLGFLGGTP